MSPSAASAKRSTNRSRRNSSTRFVESAMSLKTGDQPPGGSHRPRRWWSSITFRLTLLYLLSAAAILTASCVLVYWLLARNLDHLAGQFADDEIHDIRAALRELPGSRKFLDYEIFVEGIYPNYYA